MKRLLLSFSCSVCLLLSLTSCEVHWFSQSYDMPWYVVVIPTALFIIAVTALAGYLISRKSYRCSQCDKTFHPPWHSTVVSIHIGDRRVFRCPHCGHKGFCSPAQEE